MKNLLQYFKLLFAKIYIYIGLIPYVLGFLSAYLPEKYHFQIPLVYASSFLILAFIGANYKIWSDAQKRNKHPKIIIDYDLETFNIIYLEIKNIGNDYARNIKTCFDPNIEIKQGEQINSKNFLQNINQLAPNKKIRFFFGNFLDIKYLQKFNVKIIYEDLNGNIYRENQIIELSSFVGTSAPKKEFDEIANELKAIGKYLNIQNKNSKQVNEILKEKYK